MIENTTDLLIHGALLLAVLFAGIRVLTDR